MKNHSPNHPLKQIKLLESLPETSQPVLPLTSFLILTPYESNFNSSYNTNPDQKIIQSDHTLEKLQTDQVTLDSVKNKKN